MTHDSGFVSQGNSKTRCPTCGKLFKCMEAHHLVKHGGFPPRTPAAGSGKPVDWQFKRSDGKWISLNIAEKPDAAGREEIDPYRGTCEDRRLVEAGYKVCSSGADTAWHWQAPQGKWNDGFKSESAAVNAALRHLAALTAPVEPGQSPSGPYLQENNEKRPAAFLAWAVDMFGPVAKVRGERLMRFIEEAVELAHADNMELETLHAIIRRVYSRAPGQIEKEIGQAQACLETYAENCGYSSADLAEKEWQRVQGIPREEWTRRHSAKQAIGIALSCAGSESK